MIEVEIRSFISEEQYNKLLEFFRSRSDIDTEDYQETHYFDAPQDIRIQKNNEYAKIWLKKGQLHDDAREEIEVKCNRDDFENLEKLFASLGYEVKIKWFRTRSTFLWDGITVTIDYTKGYGHIIELEKLVEETGKDAALHELQMKMKELHIPITPKEVFKERFSYYESHWRELTQE